MKANKSLLYLFLLFFPVGGVLAQEKPDSKRPAKTERQQENQQDPEKATSGKDISNLSKSTENNKGKGKIIRSAARKSGLRVSTPGRGSNKGNGQNAVEGKGAVSTKVIQNIGRPNGVGRPGGVAPALPGVVPPAVPVPPVIRPKAPPGGKPVVPPVTPPNGLPIGIP